MSPVFSYPRFYSELEHSISKSNEQQRRKWATTIVKQDLDLKDLSKLLEGEPKVARRFLWLLSDVGITSPEKLHNALPFILELCNNLGLDYRMSFASFWHYAGVPLENEARAIALLFEWFLSPKINVTTKTRALWVLVKLSKKYPELKNELKICIEDQMDKHSKDFRKRAQKILLEL